MSQAFALTKKQMLAVDLLGGDATHYLFYGGSRSGKSFLIVRTIFIRALAVPNSRHLAARFRLNHIKASLIAETVPSVLRLCFPEIEREMLGPGHNKTDQFFKFPNGSEFWYAGLDDKDKT